MNRQLKQVIPAQASTDGAGVAIQRIAGFANSALDPVLMIDELRSEHRKDFAAGFPSHPHRGMQTLTYMKHGGIIHEDSQGNRGEIRSGGAQYMSAGSGIIHSEMPTQDTQGLHGFQLWFNLPAVDKMSAPRYRDLPRAELVDHLGPDFGLTAVAGDWSLGDGTQIAGPLHELKPRAALADLHLDDGATVSVYTAKSETVAVYIYDGSLVISGRNLPQRHALVFGAGNQLEVQAGDAGAGVLLLRGKPIGEPVVHHGPFVMNTEAEINQAIADYQAGRFAA